FLSVEKERPSAVRLFPAASSRPLRPGQLGAETSHGGAMVGLRLPGSRMPKEKETCSSLQDSSSLLRRSFLCVVLPGSSLKSPPIVRSVRSRIKIYYRKLRNPLKALADGHLGRPNPASGAGF